MASLSSCVLPQPCLTAQSQDILDHHDGAISGRLIKTFILQDACTVDSGLVTTQMMGERDSGNAWPFRSMLRVICVAFPQDTSQTFLLQRHLRFLRSEETKGATGNLLPERRVQCRVWVTRVEQHFTDRRPAQDALSATLICMYLASQ